MSKRFIIRIGYQDYMVKDEGQKYGNYTDLDVIAVLAQLERVKSTYSGGKSYYEPEEGELVLTFTFVDKEMIRPLTAIEKENKEIAELKSSLSYAKQEKERILKEKTCLENELKVFKAEEEVPQKEREVIA